MKKKNQQLYSTERALVASRQGVGFNKTPLESLLAANAATFPGGGGDNNDIFTLPFRGEQMSLGSSSGVHRKNSLSILALTSALSFITIFLSLFTLNYSSIFSLTSPTAHAADSTDSASSASLSVSVPTTIALSIASTESKASCSNDASILCLSWTGYNRRAATGSQIVDARTNNATGYTLTVDIGDEYLHSGDNKIKFEVEPDARKTTAMNSSPDKVTFDYTARADQSNYLTEMGEYSQNVTYTITANDAEGNYTADDGSTINFPYTGNAQTFVAGKSGRYRLEIWGAAGAFDITGGHEGYGGYATGEARLATGDKLFIAVGGQGDNVPNKGGGGWNGGGDADFIATTEPNAGGAHQPGGGATSIYNSLFGDGQLANYESNLPSILIVAGGGGGNDLAGKSGSGGGVSGGDGNYCSMSCGKGGTQAAAGTSNKESAGSFGKGGVSTRISAGGGGGLYGGGAGYGAGGGSGYIGNSLLANKHMYGYNVPTSDEESTKTIAGTCASETPTADCAKIGNGFARITYLDSD